nr:4'-phosphopantetheinyl transferase superfamily protein [Prevotella sp.]
MSLISIKKPADDVILGLWKIEEAEEDYYKAYPFLSDFKSEVEKFKSNSRKLEYLSVRALLYEMTKDAFLVIRHDNNGKPLVRGFNISISHTCGWSVVLLSQTKLVGVDIEYISDRVDKVASHFLRKDEVADTTENRLKIWCIKETVYKLFSSDALKYTDMRAFKIKEGYAMVINYKRNIAVPVQYEVNKDFILTFSFCQGN